MDYKTYQVPFVYKAMAKTGKERTFKPVFLRETAEWRVPVTDFAETPVVFRYDDTSLEFYKSGEHEMGRQGTLREFRVRGDAIISQMDGVLAFDRLSMDEFAQHFGRYVLYLKHFEFFNSKSRNPEYAAAFEKMLMDPNFPEASAYNVDSSTLEADRRRMTSLGSKYIEVEGRVWNRAGKPVIAISSDSSHQLLGMSIQFIEGKGEKFEANLAHAIDCNIALFPIDDFEGAKAFAHTLLENSVYHDASLSISITNLEVLIPDACQLDFDALQYAAFAKRVLYETSKNALQLGRSTTDAWHDLNDAAADLGATRDNDKIADVLTCTHRLRDAYNKAETKYGLLKTVDTLINAFTERYENRPVSAPGFGR